MINEKLGFEDKIAFGMVKGVFEKVNLEYNVQLTLRDAEGKIKQFEEIHNTVPAAGLAAIMDQLLDSPTIAVPTAMEVGTGSPAATLLGAYIAGSRTALSAKTRTDAAVEMKCTFAAGVGTGAITEAGIFSVITENTATMYCSASFAVINKAATDSLEIVWTVTATTT